MEVIARRSFDFSYRGEMFVARKGDAVEMPADLVDKLAGGDLFDLAPAQPMLMSPSEAALVEPPQGSPPVSGEPAGGDAASAPAEPLSDGAARGAGPASFRRGKRR